MFGSDQWLSNPASGFYNGVAKQSLRFDDGSSASLSKSISGSPYTYTFSAWVKRASLGSLQVIGASRTSGVDASYISFQSSNILEVVLGSGAGQQTTNLYRDTSAWYHIVVNCSGANGTAKLYVNSIEEKSWSAGSTPFLFTSTLTYNCSIGQYGGGSYYFDGYMAEVNFVDGLALDPTYFGETKNGVWIAKKPNVSEYGTNGFRLQFNQTGTGTASASTIGADTSGKTNHLTSSGIVASDCNMPDSPENNFCTYNPLDAKGNDNTYSEGNLKVVVNAQNQDEQTTGTFAVSSGKWYWEHRLISTTTTAGYFKIAIRGTDGDLPAWTVRGTDGETVNPDGSTGSSSVSYTTGNVIGVYLDMDNGKWYVSVDGTLQNSANLTNGTGYLQNTLTGTVRPFILNASSGGTHTGMGNFGQDSTFGGLESAGGYSDANGNGDFHSAVTSPYLALCSANLPEPTISPNADTQADDYFNTVLISGNSGTQAITGVGFQPDWTWNKTRNVAEHHILIDSSRGDKALRSNETIAEYDTGVSWQFDADGFTMTGTTGELNYSGRTYVAWNWKAGGTTPTKTYKVVVVSDSGNKYRFRNSADSATFAQSAVALNLQEGGTYTFDWSDSTATSHPFRFSTTSDGTHGGGSEYTTGVVKDDTAKTITITVASSAPTLYYYCSSHSGMGGQVNTNTTSGSTNFDGSILSVSQANTTAGFSIVTYTGTNSNATVGHGLGVAPSMIIAKARGTPNGSARSWFVYHKDLGASAFVYLDLTNGQVTSNTTVWGGVTPSTTVFSLGQEPSVNWASENYIAYCFAEIEGYSRFGSYTGNSSADGTFVFTGFRPAFILWKKTTGADDWGIHDNTRDTTNVVENVLRPNLTNAEFGGVSCDFLSNGFKWRVNSGLRNTSGQKYIYMAFAEAPFKYANAR